MHIPHLVPHLILLGPATLVFRLKARSSSSNSALLRSSVQPLTLYTHTTMKSFVTLACLLAHVYAQDSADAVQTATAIAAEPTETLPTQVQVPPKQAWCPSDIFCAGPVSAPLTRVVMPILFVLHFNFFYSIYQLLQTLNLAELYPDDKTYVDKVSGRLAFVSSPDGARGS